MITKDRTSTESRTVTSKAKSKAELTGLPRSQKTQAKLPEKDYEALHRRAEELSRKVLQEPDVDNKEKVERIKAEIENGTYQVDAESIAQKLMEIEHQISDKGTN